MMLKFCGLRRAEDVDFANEILPDYAGFVFAESRRKVSPEAARELSAALAPSIRAVGVFVNEPLAALLCTAQTASLSVLQLHGDEDAAYIRAARASWRGEIWKAVRVRTAEDIRAADLLPVDRLLLDAFSPDAYGGTGSLANLALIAEHRPRHPFFLAGGLNAGNLAGALSLVCPNGVDISGGIETDGFKDRAKMREIKSILKGVK